MSFDVGLVGKPPSDLRSDEHREPLVRSTSVGKSTFLNGINAIEHTLSATRKAGHLP